MCRFNSCYFHLCVKEEIQGNIQKFAGIWFWTWVALLENMDSMTNLLWPLRPIHILKISTCASLEYSHTVVIFLWKQTFESVFYTRQLSEHLELAFMADNKSIQDMYWKNNRLHLFLAHSAYCPQSTQVLQGWQQLKCFLKSFISFFYDTVSVGLLA